MNSTVFKPGPQTGWRPLTVLDRMVTLELLKTLTTVLAVLVTIIVSRKFLDILTKAIEGQVATETLFILLGLKMLSATIQLLPPSTFLSMLMVFGRMYRDHEMTVLASSGAGVGRIYRAIAYFALPLSVLAAVLSFQVMPWSERQVQELMHKDKQSADVRGIKPGRFNEFSRGDVVLYAESLSETENLLTNVFVQSRSNDTTGIVVSATGHLTENEAGEHFVVLNNGRRYQGTPGQSDFIISEFEEYAVKIDEAGNETANFRREAEPSETLWRSRTPVNLAELQRRFAVPLGLLCMVFLAVPLSRVAPRGGVYGNVFTAFLIFITYENLQRITQGMLITGRIPLWVSYSAGYALVLSIGAFLLIRAAGLRWIWQCWAGRA